ncbi:hypothetical protein EOM75_05430 [Candidatus Falkowbacteria bacterium]|jgi:hypothetical protein|nr:hypothetical protein [Candidatus Falkowbacteria bacterium]
MKKGLLLLLLILSLGVQAQFVKKAGFYSGVAIFTQEWATYEIPGIAYSTTDLGGFNYALFAELINSDFVNIRASCGYVGKGVDELFNGTVAVADYVGTYTTRLNYLYTAALSKLQLPSGSVRPYIMAGPRWDFQLSLKSDKEMDEYIINNNKVVFGYDFGGGVEFNFDYFGINLEARYSGDFNEFLEIADSDLYPSQKIKNQGFILALGMSFYF